MLITASEEFVALCREQMALLTQGLGADLSVVYLTQEFVGEGASEAKLIPVVVYPETAVVAVSGNSFSLPTPMRPLLQPQPDSVGVSSQQEANPGSVDQSSESLFASDQIVLPLIHEDMMMGLLVTGRSDRTWNSNERDQIQRIAKTLSIACILDQRRAWLAQQLHQEQLLQEKQRDLLDNLLHQFRNPLTALRTFGKLLMKRLAPADANREAAASIVRESDRLKELLQQFDQAIDLTVPDLELLAPLKKEVVVEASTVQTNCQPTLLLPGVGSEESDCYLAEILEPLLISSRAIAEAQNLELISEIPANLPKVRANAAALREVLNNIIDNALKYTPAGGKVLVQAGQKKGNYQGVAISDTGPGIPQEDIKHLGERYYRGVQAKSEIPGTGIGFSIAKQLIEQMQGEIEVFSPALNLFSKSPDAPGTTFIVWLKQL